MVIIHRGRMSRKITGGRYRMNRGKRTFERGSRPTMTTIGPKNKSTSKRTKGGSRKVKSVIAHTVNLYNPKDKSFSKAKVISVSDNPASRHFVRQNVLTKGSIIVTEKGKAKVTSRPGQNGTVNAMIVS